MLVRRAMKFVPAVVYQSCHNLPETFLQPLASIISRPSIHVDTAVIIGIQANDPYWGQKYCLYVVVRMLQTS